MTTGLVILVFLLDGLEPTFSHDRSQPEPWLYGGWLLGVVVGASLLFGILRRRLESTGRARNIVRADRVLSISRAAVVGLHAYGLVSLGWGRSAGVLTHNIPVVREFVTALPPLLAFVALFWGYAPILRRVREALLWRHLHGGAPILPDRSVAGLVWEHVRHSILLGLIPLLMLTAWRHMGEAAASFETLYLGPSTEYALLAWQVAGVFAVLAVSPFLLRFVWDTVPLEGGALRESVERVFSRNRVTAREVLVWQTSSGILNGALMGIIPRARYVLFTDALLQILPLRQVEAVAAHEAGHGRLHHLPWLLGSTIVASLAGASAFAFYLEFARPTDSWYLNAAGVLASVGLGFCVLGSVSRRFELQADAFAAKDLSLHPQPSEEPAESAPILKPAKAITHESAGSMIDALETVSRLNGIAPERFTWRHGTVRGRQAHLAGIVGLPLSDLPIDRTVRRLKALTVIGAGAVALVVVAGVLFAPSRDTLRDGIHGTEPEGAATRQHDPRLGHAPAR